MAPENDIPGALYHIPLCGLVGKTTLKKQVNAIFLLDFLKYRPIMINSN
jgi:hypothetical protein